MKLIDNIKKHYVIFIPIALILVLILSYAIYNIQKLYNNYSKIESKELYTFFAGIKVEDKFDIRFNRKNEILEIKPSKKMKLNTIIYNKEKNRVIFPNDMNIIMVSDNYKQLKVNKNAILDYDKSNTSYLLKTVDYEKIVDNFFLYDGNDLYFMPEFCTLVINDEKIDLSAMSFVIFNNNNSLEYYDNETDSYVTKNVENDKVSIVKNGFTITLNDDAIERPNGIVLLRDPSYQDLIK